MPPSSSAMTDQQLSERIILDPKVMTGKPVVRGTRLTVEFVLNLLAHGSSQAEILAEYQGLTSEDLKACLLFDNWAMDGSSFKPLEG
jgi:uncharacterized protein (DUF433 family)